MSFSVLSKMPFFIVGFCFLMTVYLLFFYFKKTANNNYKRTSTDNSLISLCLFILFLVIGTCMSQAYIFHPEILYNFFLNGSLKTDNDSFLYFIPKYKNDYNLMGIITWIYHSLIFICVFSCLKNLKKSDEKA